VLLIIVILATWKWWLLVKILIMAKEKQMDWLFG
jgi:hypothetical protein